MGGPPAQRPRRLGQLFVSFKEGNKQALFPKLAGQRGSPGRRERERGREGGREMRGPARSPAPAQTSARGGHRVNSN